MTTIEWTNETWNPVTGCTKVSPGCKNCYAERLAPKVFAGQCATCGHSKKDHCCPDEPFCCKCACVEFKQRTFTDVRTHPDRLEQPLHWRKPRKVFVNSMSDLFHEDVPLKFIVQVFATCVVADQHIYQILTKRPERMRTVVNDPLFAPLVMDAAQEIIDRRAAVDIRAVSWDLPAWPLKNVWLGVSVEDQKHADERVTLLLKTPAAVRFVSYEPALGPVDFDNLNDGETMWTRPAETIENRLDWIIVGGESGPGARPFNIQWARDVIAQCKAAGVAVFVKQMGGNAQERNDRIADVWYYADGSDMDTEALDADSYRYQGAPVRIKLKSSKGGDPAEWPADLRVREFPA